MRSGDGWLNRSPVPDATQVWTLATASGWWTIKNNNSNKLLEIAGASTADGAAAQQRTANGSATQQWRLVKELVGGTGQ